MLSRTDENHGALCGRDGTQGSATLSMTVKLGYNNGADLESFVESESLIVASLTDRAIHHEDAGVWVYNAGDLLHFFE